MTALAVFACPMCFKGGGDPFAYGLATLLMLTLPAAMIGGLVLVLRQGADEPEQP